MIEYTNRWYIGKGTYIYFNGSWNGQIKNALMKVMRTQRFPVRYPMVIKKGEYTDFNLSDNGLYPANPSTLYELGVGIKGEAVLYVRLPDNVYFDYLEKSGFIPSEDLSSNKYIGGFTEYEIPVEEPRRLRVYTVKNMVSSAFRILADNYEDSKVILCFTVNRMKIDKVGEAEEMRVKREWDKLVDEGKLVVLDSYELKRW